MSKTTISLLQLFQQFPDQESARIYLENKRWNNNPQCPHCQSNKITTRKSHMNGYFACNSCKKAFTVRTGTIFERSHIPLHKWIYAIYMILTARKGISSLQLSKEIGITQKSAWFMLQRIREACKSNDTMLDGIVEIDESYFGGLEKNKHKHKKTKGTQGRSTKTKTAVVGMKERTTGQIKAKKMDKVNKKNIKKLVNNSVSKNSIIMSDEATFYRGISHYMVNHSVGEFVNDMASTNGIESVWAVLKRGFNGTYHHFSKKHINRYIDEFTFRLNDGNVKNHIFDRMDSLFDGAFGKRLTYKELVE